MAKSVESIRFGVDRLALRGKRIFGWGWVADPERRIYRVELEIKTAAGCQYLPANYGLLRTDVVNAFPELASRENAGFVISGYAAVMPVGELSLKVHFDDGDLVLLSINHVLETVSEHKRRLRGYGWLLKSTWRRLLRFDFAGILRRARSQELWTPALNDDEAVELLGRRFEGRAGACVILDHDMGGGANQYRSRHIEARLATGSPVVLCTYVLPTLDYRLSLFIPGAAEEIFRVSSFVALGHLFDVLESCEIFLNSPVSFDDPLLLSDFLTQTRKARSGFRLIVSVHDFFAVCPSYVLLNADGQFCGIPANPSVCADCLGRHQASFVALSPPTEISVWRAAWWRCLEVADEIRCFSISTRDLLLRAYPELNLARLTVVPHVVTYNPSRLPEINANAPMKIGVIGHISDQKGAGILADLVRLLDQQASPVEMVVIGTLDTVVSSRRLTVTGTYRHEDLVGLIETHGVNVFLFPSICPETFSYMTEEMMILRLPVVAFDLGAPAERLRGYDLGRVSQETSAQAALNELDVLYQQRKSLAGD